MEFKPKNRIKKNNNTKPEKKKNFKPSNFDIRFHLYPGTKVLKTVDGQTILYEIEKTGRKFTCENQLVDLETGLYFGKKDSYTENKNIYVHGEITSEEVRIKWEIRKI